MRVDELEDHNHRLAFGRFAYEDVYTQAGFADINTGVIATGA